MEVTNRFRGLDLIDRVPEELWTEVHDIVQETDQDHPQEKEMQKRCAFHYRGLECKCRNQETPGVTGKFGLGVQNEAGQRLIEFCQQNALWLRS